jgi:hypothetical protein
MTWPSGRRSRVDRAMSNASSRSCSNRTRSGQTRRHGLAGPARAAPDPSPAQHRSRHCSSRPDQYSAQKCDSVCSGEPTCPSSSPLDKPIIERPVLPQSRRSRFADDDRSRRCSAASSPCGGSASANTASWISRTARNPRADGIASFDQTLFTAPSPGAHQPATAGLPREPRRVMGVVLGSLGRGMQADGVWAHLPATTGPIAAVPARGCPHRVATRPGVQSARCTGVPVSRPYA